MVAGGVEFPDLRGFDLVCASDYSGGTKLRPYFTATFLIVPTNAVREWDEMRIKVRKKWLVDGRTMSFKGLNDQYRRQALSEFLAAADHMEGVLFTFSIAKGSVEVFCSSEEMARIQAAGAGRVRWKDASLRKMMMLSSLHTFLVGGLIGKWRGVFWVTDDDDFTGSHERMLDLNQWLKALRARNMPGHRGQAVVQAASRMANDQLEMCFEDLCAIPDLVAGAWAETIAEYFPRSLPDPDESIELEIPELSSKSLKIAKWFAQRHGKLCKAYCLVGSGGQNGAFTVLASSSEGFPLNDLGDAT
ncbi:hypothetical protein Hhel01_02268 [Haloferula helveola]